MDWEDYINFDLNDITRFAGDDAVELIQSTVESTIEPLIRAIELAQSDRELEMAEAELEAYSMDISEAESLTEEIELNNLIDYMGQSYKGDMDMIERYLELTGQGGGPEGGFRRYAETSGEKKRRLEDIEKDKRRDKNSL
tara:strand:- start:1011 stop:1430 length:420 start_codon:yes stop_codon:yes gene_type:complete